jgi:hypothetical protein
VALLLKADLFEIMSRMDKPWETLGWVHVENYRWMRSAASNSVPGAIYAAAGCVFTGVALGFGSKFWHDTLGAVYEVRDMTRIRNTRSAADSGGAVAPRTPPVVPPSTPTPTPGATPAPAGGTSHA